MLLLTLSQFACAQSLPSHISNGTTSDALATDLQLLDDLYSDKLISKAIYERRRSRLLSLADLAGGASRLPTPTDNTTPDASDSQAQHLQLSLPSATDNTGKRIALLIGNNEYRTLPVLETPINDIQALAKVLRKGYGYDSVLLQDATRTQILSALSHYRDTLGVDDRLILYYAGHGIIDEITKRGYWLPIDADEQNPSNWVSSVEVSDLLFSIKAQHTLVIADSCFSGSLLEQRSTVAAASTDVDSMRSRTLITSGGLEPVLDSGFGENSVFATALLNALSINPVSHSIDDLFELVRHEVRGQVDQTPHYGTLAGAGHIGGEFPLY